MTYDQPTAMPRAAVCVCAWGGGLRTNIYVYCCTKGAVRKHSRPAWQPGSLTGHYSVSLGRI